MKNNEMYQSVISEILYDREKNTDKCEGHIWGISANHAYVLWNYHYIGNVPSKQYYLKKFGVTSDRILDMIYDWYHQGFINCGLDLYNEYEDHYIFIFLESISYKAPRENQYYFPYSESISPEILSQNLKCIEQEPNFIFPYLLCGSYFFHKGALNKAKKFYNTALTKDIENPYIYYQILRIDWLGEKNKRNYEKMCYLYDTKINKPFVVISIIQASLELGFFEKGLKYFEIYCKDVVEKNKTYEPYLFAAEIYFQIGDIESASRIISKFHCYYLGIGNYNIFIELVNKIRETGYQIQYLDEYIFYKIRSILFDKFHSVNISHSFGKACRVEYSEVFEKYIIKNIPELADGIKELTFARVLYDRQNHSYSMNCDFKHILSKLSKRDNFFLTYKIIEWIDKKCTLDYDFLYLPYMSLVVYSSNKDNKKLKKLYGEKVKDFYLNWYSFNLLPEKHLNIKEVYRNMKESLEINQQNPQLLADFARFLGIHIYRKTGDIKYIDKAISYLKLSIKISGSHTRGYVYTWVGAAYKQKKEFEKAGYYINLGLDLYKESGYQYYLALSWKHSIMCITGSENEILKYTQELKNIENIQGEFILRIYKNMCSFYHGRGNYNKMYEYICLWLDQYFLDNQYMEYIEKGERKYMHICADNNSKKEIRKDLSKGFYNYFDFVNFLYNKYEVQLLKGDIHFIGLNYFEQVCYEFMKGHRGVHHTLG